MLNSEISNIFQKIASILQIQGANVFRIRAYEQAAMMIVGLPRELSEIYKTGGLKILQELPGIGEDLSLKIEELVKTNQLKYLIELQKKIPAGLLDVLAIEGMGPKRTKQVFEKFSVKNIRDLQRLLASGKLEKISGWGKKSVENIKQGIGQWQKFSQRLTLGEVLPLAENLVTQLKNSGLVEQIAIAGSLRRRQETIGDIDLLATSSKPQQLIEIFTKLPQVKRVIAKGHTKCLVTLKNGLDADLRVLQPQEFGAGLYYFTGSKAHNIATRLLAIKKGLTISEYGVFQGTKEVKGKQVAGASEAEIFKVLGLDYIPPELRENTGEIEAAQRHTLPKLIGFQDLRGDLHLHTKWSDGGASVLEMLQAAKAKSLSYVAITDHASSMGMVQGIKLENYKKYITEVRAAGRKVPGLNVLAGSEVDILENGSLYLSDKILSEFDWILGAVHSHFKMSHADMTKRLIKALRNPFVHGLAHPTSRLLQKRALIDFDMVAVMKAAAKYKKVLELDALPERLDLSAVHCRLAKEYGVKIVINSDAHLPSQMDCQYGIATARRGWLEKGDVLNAWEWGRVKEWIERRYDNK